MMTTQPENSQLARLQAFAGKWDVQVDVGGQTIEGGWTTFEWIENGAYLRQYTDAEFPPDVPDGWREHSPLPAVQIIGLDDTSDTYSVLYSDARGVYRVYQMRFDGRDWELWREAPGFSQRFRARFRADGDRIEGAWEYSEDGFAWEHDFNLTYLRSA